MASVASSVEGGMGGKVVDGANVVPTVGFWVVGFVVEGFVVVVVAVGSSVVEGTITSGIP